MNRDVKIDSLHLQGNAFVRQMLSECIIVEKMHFNTTVVIYGVNVQCLVRAFDML